MSLHEQQTWTIASLSTTNTYTFFKSPVNGRVWDLKMNWIINMFDLLSCYFNIISLLNWVIVCIRLRLSIKHVKLDEMKNNSKTNPSSYQNTLCCSYQKQQNHSNRSLNRQSIVILCISASFCVFLCNCKRCKFTKKMIGGALWVHKQCIDEISNNYSGFTLWLTSKDKLSVTIP